MEVTGFVRERLESGSQENVMSRGRWNGSLLDQLKRRRKSRVEFVGKSL